MHPHTRKIIEQSHIKISKNIQTVDPLSYQEFLNLVSYSGLVTTDSGGLQKEAYLLNVPCVTLRSSTEWVETVESNANRIVGANHLLISKTINEMFNKKIYTKSSIFGNGKAAEIIVKELVENDPEIPTVPDPWFCDSCSLTKPQNKNWLSKFLKKGNKKVALEKLQT
jgi:UDP-N-acetylglucosamine 2-epimerase